MAWKDFLYFHSNEKLAVILLLILIALVLVINGIGSRQNQRAIVVQQNDSVLREFERFQQELQPISPEEKQARVRSTSTSETPYIYKVKQENSSEAASSSKTFAPYPKQEKLEAGETLSLNEADTAEWKKVPGVGSTYARRIVKYGELLGGYVSTEQLREVYGMDDERFAQISPYVVASGSVQRLAINELEFKQLLRHPYLNYEQVKAIVNLRRKIGRIQSLEELAMLDEFSPENIERLKPYVKF